MTDRTAKKDDPDRIEDFEKLRKNDHYYVDKTGLIRELLANRAEVTLFTRPRRFVKSLNMSMLAHFFSPNGDKSVFDSLLDDPNAEPKDYWISTSGNDAVKRFIGMTNGTTRQKIESLVAGETVEKTIREDFNCPEMYRTIDNLRSLLFMTGYLTQRGRPRGRVMRLAIPNLEIRDIFVTQILDSFDESVRADTDTLDAFCAALRDGDAGTAEQLFARYLERSISIRDNAVPDDRKENFYHGVMLGILMANDRWDVLSNLEAGKGYADILAKSEDGETGIVIEMKYADDGKMEDTCRDALGQPDERRYRDAFKYIRVKTVRRYGIAIRKAAVRWPANEFSFALLAHL